VIRLLVFAAAVWFAFQWWKGSNDPVHKLIRDGGVVQEASNGFVNVVMPDGARNNTVLIFAPVNCSSEAAQRADGLATELTRLGIPNERSSRFSSSINNPSSEQQDGVQRAVAVINGEIPAVFINGMAKANPTVEDVVAEFKRTQ
jgi:hypothetical protein